MATRIDTSRLPIGKIISGAVAVVIVIMLIGILFGAWFNVPEGYVGVIFHSFGENQGFDTVSIGQGWGMKMPFRDKVFKIPFRTQTIGFYGSSETTERGQYGAIQPKDKNGITFDVDITVRYHLDPTQAPAFIEQKGEGIAAMEAILSTAVRADSTRGVFGKYAQEDVPQQRTDISTAIREVLQQRINSEAARNLKPDFIVVEAVDIRNVKFNDQIEAAIVTKQTAKQTAERKEYELQAAQKEKEIVLVQADRDKQAAVLRAEGEAEAVKLVAFAKAAGIQAVNNAYQDMPVTYVQAKFADAIKPTDKIIFGLESLQGSLNFMDIGKISSLYNTEAAK